MSQRTCNLQDFTARLRSRSASYPADAPRDSSPLPRREIDDAINQEAEKLAQELDMWIPFEDTFKLGTPAIGGVENENYLNAEEHMMYKMNNLMTSHSILALFARLLLHNDIFPQTAYELVGFTGFGHGSIYPILCQPYIPRATYASHGEILDYMESLGFKQCGEAAFTNGKIVISDLRPRNVLKSISNAIYVVDAEYSVK